MSMPYSTAGATLRRANIAAGLPYATTSPRATNKSSAIACLCYARVESGDLGAKRGDDFGRRGFKPDVRTRVLCASALPVVVTLASPTANKIINDRMGYPLFDCWLSASGGIGGAGHKIGTRTEKFEVLWANAGRPRQELRRRNQHDLAAVGSSAFCDDSVA